MIPLLTTVARPAVASTPSWPAVIDAFWVLTSRAPAVARVGVLSMTPKLATEPLSVNVTPLGTVPPDARVQ